MGEREQGYELVCSEVANWTWQFEYHKKGRDSGTHRFRGDELDMTD